MCAADATDIAASSNGSDSSSPVEGDSPSDKESPAENGTKAPQILLEVQVATGMDMVKAEEWDACASGCGVVNPFLSHAFLLALEVTGSAAKEEGWLPQHVLVRDAGTKELLGAVPLYLKSHSYGEYVFDNSWAYAYQNLGGSYYPKLQSCVPFTPVTGARVLLRPSTVMPAVRRVLAQTLKAIADELGVSSLHMTFTQESEAEVLQKEGYLRRTGIQYHWENRGYKDFEEYLAALKMRKRKNVRTERKAVRASGLVLKKQSGHDLRPRDWDAFYDFYLNTTDKKWGQAYLKRGFFHAIGETMPDAILLASAYQDDELVAGALNLVGSDCIYGRNWGCKYGLDVKHLHFELCYYQAIEAAIERGIPRVEAGAQGEHKIQRGYLPTLTHSVHYIRDERFRTAVAGFLKRENAEIDYALEALTAEASPYKDAEEPQGAQPAHEVKQKAETQKEN
eukprot:CAMPEP_0206140138 /NCGR_PEP_ID=MMETSP1473-20131121/8532_1 /ASSEMBLY_ACC=CAM_ASM_001109 /TAXON_ID=1461547 /ORGANISM="Stichococcus sp, Strain RCC1054" /LENGTH=451 /DNA_ID=CAMNT_0053534183 /DNA_START=303 /DNA_END=1658 /DNA_ORIENTATION=-